MLYNIPRVVVIGNSFIRRLRTFVLGSPQKFSVDFHLSNLSVIEWHGIGGRTVTVTKNRCVTYVKIRGYANFVSSLLAYLISAVASWFSNSILSRFRMLLQIVCYFNITLFSTAGKF